MRTKTKHEVTLIYRLPFSHCTKSMISYVLGALTLYVYCIHIYMQCVAFISYNLLGLRIKK